MMRRLIRLSLLMALLLAIGALTTSLLAQSDETIVTVAINEWQQDAFDDETFADFEAANPGVKVVPVILGRDDSFFGRPNLEEDGGVEEHIENHYQYAGRADVLPVSTFQLDYYATRTGAYLDIGPLLQADSDANLDDYHPAILESFQWDGATWGLPISGSVNLVIYDRIAFDNANLAYPDPSWTLADYANASLELAERNDEGEITQPGIMSFNVSGLMRAQLGENLIDESSFPAMPDFSNPELLDMLRTWQEYQETLRSQQAENMQRGGNPAEQPLSISGLYALEGFGMQSEEERDLQATFLPNDRATINASGYAVSAGSANPQLAYELIQFMTTSPEVVWRSFGDVTARRSMQGVEPEDTPFQRPDRPQRIQQLVDEAIEKAIPTSELYFFGNVINATFAPPTSGEDSGDESPPELERALQDTEDQIRNQLTAIAEAGQQQTNVLSVATPVPTPVLSDDEISLDFIYSGTFGNTDRNVWEDKASEFIAQDAEVGNINLSSQFPGNIEETLAEQDCLYFGQNILQFADASLLLPLDPFLSADPQFNEENIIGNVMNEVRIEGQTYALPMFLQPVVMWYNSNQFEEAGVPVPENGWDVSAFEDTLRQLKPTMPDGDAPYQSQTFGSGIHIQLLAAAYGAENLIDYSTEPATYNLTTDTNIQALQEVLNLAKDGYMGYQRLATSDGGSMFGRGGIPLQDSIFNPGDWQMRNRGQADFEDPRRLVTFPRGSGSIPTSYTVAMAVISAESDAPDACYRWLSWLSQQPDLPGGVPVNRNLTENNAFADALGEDIASFYQAYADLLEQPNVVEIGSPFGTGGSSFYVSYSNYISRLLVNRAFDRYVLDDANLADELTAAEQYIDEYKVCAVEVPIPENRSDLTPEQSIELSGQFRECAVSVDASIGEILPAPPGSSDDDE